LIQNSQYKVLITTSGLGSRLGNLTEYTNKSLVVVGDKPTISHIIEMYPKDTIFVVTLGHFGHHVKQFLSIAYPNRIFEFVEVLPYRGVGSSLAFSMLQAQDKLQCSFIYHASDSILMGELVPSPSYNWVAGQKSEDATNYASFDVSFPLITKFHDKGMVDFDYLHIGVIGINDYEIFWDNLKSLVLDYPADESLNDLAALIKMLSTGVEFRVWEVLRWFDIGNSHSLQKTRLTLSNNSEVLEKSNESISFIDGKVIKFFSDEITCQNRVERAQILSGIVPKVSTSSENFYSYEFIDGEIASKIKDPKILEKLLSWASDNVWQNRDVLTEDSFKQICVDFYKNKTLGRLEDFFMSTGVRDLEIVINGQVVPPVGEMLDDAIKLVLSDVRQSMIHGDFILDNIVRTNDGFKLIDWRQDFGGSLESGDTYYDLAKLHHSFYINHELVSRNLFEVTQTADGVVCGILRKDYLVEMEHNFNYWVELNGFSQGKVSVLTSLIWLNMSPLHHHPFNRFLYFYGRYRLWRSLNVV
jgi:hypothetical protein